MRHQKVREELNATFEEREVRLQELLVPRVFVVLPKVGAKPSAADRKRPPTRPVHRRRDAPKVGVLVEHPPACAVVLLRHLRALIRNVADQLEQRFGQIAEVGRLRRPVVHLRVDVGRVLRVPHGVHVVVPNPLQVRRLRAGTRRRNQNVAPEVVNQRRQARVGPRLNRLLPLVRWEVAIFRMRQLQRSATEQPPVVRHGGLPQAVVRLSGHVPQSLFNSLMCVGADVMVVHEVGRRNEHQRHRVRLLDNHVRADRLYRAAIQGCLYAPFVTQLARYT